MRAIKKFLVMMFFISQSINANACETIGLNIKFHDLNTKIRVEIADTFLKRKKGLMFRKHLALNSGMLFVYDYPQKAKFWMKNTFIPLDIAFADGTGRVVTLVQHAKPLQHELIDGGDNIQYVLEINAGMAKKFNLFEDSMLEHPIIQLDAGKFC